VAFSYHVGLDLCYAFLIDCTVKSSFAVPAFEIGVCALLEEEFNHRKTVANAGINEAGVIIRSLLVIEEVIRGVLVDEVARLVVTGR
jgi:hypothetical protein